MRLLASQSAKVWKYEVLATGLSPGDFVVLSTSQFEAANLAAAKSILAMAVTNLKAQDSTMPNAIRLIDPGGEEIWRALIAGPRHAVRQPIHDPLLLARRKRRHH